MAMSILAGRLTILGTGLYCTELGSNILYDTMTLLGLRNFFRAHKCWGNRWKRTL
jgi:hypothetical protein